MAVGVPPSGDLMLIQGPLTFNWRRRSHGVLPRMEDAYKAELADLPPKAANEAAE